MLWFAHSRYKDAVDRFARNVSEEEVHRAIGHPTVLFLCGGGSQSRRAQLEKYLNENRENWFHFRAETVWNALDSTEEQINALDLEKRLAAFSDAIVMLVESAGSIAELGAFSLPEEIRRKLIPILDDKYRNEASFINTGPVKWIHDDEDCASPIYADYSTILTSVGRIESQVRGRARSRRISSLKRKELLVLVCFVTAAIGPAPKNLICKAAAKIHRTVENNRDSEERVNEELRIALLLADAIGLTESGTIEQTQLYLIPLAQQKQLFPQRVENAISRERLRLLEIIRDREQYRDTVQRLRAE